MTKIKVLPYRLATDCFNNIIDKNTGEILVESDREVF